MNKEEMRIKFKQFRTLVNEARATGLNDLEIIEMLGLQPRPLGKKTREILRAIQQGEAQPDATDIAEKIYGDKSKYRVAYYHLTKLVDAGYIYEEV